MDWYLTKRTIRHWWQRRTRGWDDSELWCLDATIARFVLPRLKRFREVAPVRPGGMQKAVWDKHLDDIIYAMDVCSSEESKSDIDWDRVLLGLERFGECFRCLWW